MSYNWKNFSVREAEVEHSGEFIDLGTAVVRVVSRPDGMYTAEINSWDGIRSQCRFKADSMEEAKSVGVGILSAHLHTMSESYSSLGNILSLIYQEAGK